MTTISPGLKKYVEREAPAGAPPARPGSKVHVHFTATVRSRDEVVDSSRGEFTTEVGGVTVRKCNVPLALTLPGGGAAERDDAARDIVDATVAREPSEETAGESSGARERLNARGFVLGVLSMRLGERATFCADAALAYGERGKGVVGPNEAMDFDIELVGVDGAYFPARRGR